MLIYFDDAFSLQLLQFRANVLSQMTNVLQINFQIAEFQPPEGHFTETPINIKIPGSQKTVAYFLQTFSMDFNVWCVFIASTRKISSNDLI